MPREQEVSEMQMEEMPLPKLAAVEGRKPVFRARVVYLGAMRNKSLSLPGQILLTRFEGEGSAHWEQVTFAPETGERIIVPKQGTEVREISDGGMTCYDFSSHDLKGNVIESRMMPETAKPHLRRKPWIRVEHPDHLVYFYTEKGPGGEAEFEVMASAEEQPSLMTYIERSVRATKSRQELIEQVTT